MIEHRLKNLNILTSVVVIREDRTIQQQVEDATRRDCLFAVVINSQNEVHRSLTLNILHGLPQGKNKIQLFFFFFFSVLLVHISQPNNFVWYAFIILDRTVYCDYFILKYYQSKTVVMSV